MKQCGVCGKVKPRSEFHRRRASPDGLQARCKQCRAEVGHPNRTSSEREQTAAWNRASKRLRDEHPEEFYRYYEEEKGSR